VKANSRIATLVFRRADLVFFMEILGRLPWEVALTNKMVQQSWLILKDYLFKEQERSILMWR